MLRLHDTTLHISRVDRHALTLEVAGLCRTFNDTSKGRGCIVSEREAWHGQVRAFRSLGDVALKQQKRILAHTPIKTTPLSFLRLALVAPTLPIP
jgi:hypothetical protein